MEAKTNIVDPLIERVEQYGKTSFELLKLKSLDKTADVSSAVISRLILGVVLLLFTLTLNTAIALWLGDLLGKTYYGFLIVAAFYALAGIIIYFLHPPIKARINNAIIKQVINEPSYAKN
jgi:hypothetical protein